MLIYAIGLLPCFLCTTVNSEGVSMTSPALSDGSGQVILKTIDGRPTVFRDGTRLLPSAYCNCILGPNWEKWTDYFIRSGVRTHYLNLLRIPGGNRFWRDEDEYSGADPADRGRTIDHQARHILKQMPDALFIVRFGTTVPTKWAKRNPGEMQTDSEGRLYPEASYASEKFLKGLDGFFNSVVSHCESQSWGTRVIGYMIFPYGEGLTPLSLKENFYDRSEATRKAWGNWLTEKYGSTAKLQKAWGKKEVRLSSIEVPTDESLREKVAGIREWPSAKEMRMERDYARFQQELFRRWMTTMIDSLAEATAGRNVLMGIDALKQPLLGWQHNEAFYGVGKGSHAFSMFLSSGSIGAGQLLDHPELDCLITPADYHARGMGFGFEGEGLSDSMVLRHKLLLIENDARTFLGGEGPERKPPLGAFMSLKEIQAGLLRNTALAWSRGLQHYWMDIDGGFFNSEEIQKVVRTDKKVVEAASKWPHRETEHAIAFVIDDEAPLYGNFTKGFHNLAIIRQRIEGLALSGIPHRIFLLSDLERDDFPAYRCYLFPNLFKVDDRIIDLLKRKVFRDGRMAIFGPGTGITDGENVSKDGAERLLGIPMKLHNSTCSRRVRLRDRTLKPLEAENMPALYGDTYMYGPVLAPDEDRLVKEGVEVLGDAVFTFWVNTAGLALKEFGKGASGNGQPGPRGPKDYAVVFSGAIPLPPQLLKSLARYGGCNVWCEDDVVVSASDSMVSVHGTEPRPLTIRLPGRYKRIVDAVTGRTVAQGDRELRIRLKPPETRVLFLER